MTARFFKLLGLQPATTVLPYVVVAVCELAGWVGVGTVSSKTTSLDSTLERVQWSFFVGTDGSGEFAEVGLTPEQKATMS